MQEGTVLLVESDPVERVRLRETLAAAGFGVIACPGPSEPDHMCIGRRKGFCPFVEGADIVVLDPWLVAEDQPADDLIELYTSRGRTVVLLGSAGRSDPSDGGHVVALGDGPAAKDVVAAVQAAPGTDRFVLRGR
jgi:hypothetical protein